MVPFLNGLAAFSISIKRSQTSWLSYPMEQWNDKSLNFLPAALIRCGHAGPRLRWPQEYRPYGAAHRSKAPRPARRPGVRYVDGTSLQSGLRASGAFATQPWENEPPCQPAPVY